MEPTPAKPRKTPLLPRGDQQLAAAGISIGAYWAARPWLTLRYETAAKFVPKAAAYNAAIATRQQAGSVRPIEADEILTLDEKIDRTLYRVKNRLTDKYDKKTAPSHYPTVGITKQGKNFILETERPKRAAALLTLVAGLTTEGIADGEWGTAFWEPIAKRYNDLVPHLTETDGKVSQAVAAKDVQRAYVTTVCSSIIKAIDANFPDETEYKAELRAAGLTRQG